jgi:hypothetical protein
MTGTMSVGYRKAELLRGRVMETTQTSQNIDFSAAPRAVVGTAADLIFRLGCTVLGPANVPTAKDNAWAAVCADRERAREREEVSRLVSAAKGR